MDASLRLVRLRERVHLLNRRAAEIEVGFCCHCLKYNVMLPAELVLPVKQAVSP